MEVFKMMGLNDKQKRLNDFRPKVVIKNIYPEFEYLISEYKKAYNTDKFDKYDLYDFTWDCHGRLKNKNFQRNGFFSANKIYENFMLSIIIQFYNDIFILENLDLEYTNKVKILSIMLYRDLNRYQYARAGIRTRI